MSARISRHPPAAPLTADALLLLAPRDDQQQVLVQVDGARLRRSSKKKRRPQRRTATEALETLPEERHDLDLVDPADEVEERVYTRPDDAAEAA
jgi:hypothetical protein